MEQHKSRPKLSNKTIDNRNESKRFSVRNDDAVEDIFEDVFCRHIDAEFEDRREEDGQLFDLSDI